MAIRIVVTTVPERTEREYPLPRRDRLEFYNCGVDVGALAFPDSADANAVVAGLRQGGFDVTDLREPEPALDVASI